MYSGSLIRRPEFLSVSRDADSQQSAGATFLMQVKAMMFVCHFLFWLGRGLAEDFCPIRECLGEVGYFVVCIEDQGFSQGFSNWKILSRLKRGLWNVFYFLFLLVFNFPLRKTLLG